MAEGTPGRTGWPVAVVATLGMSVSYIDRQTLAAIAPAVRAVLAIDHAQYGWLVSAFSMAYLVGAPAAGLAVDRFGARKSFALAVVIWSIVAGAHALVASFAMLFALRILLGLAESPSFPSAARAIHQSLPGRRRNAAFGLLFTGSSIGAMIAAPLAIAIEARYRFRFAFVGTALVGACWIPIWLFVTKGRLPEHRAAPTVANSTPISFATVATSAPVVRAIVAVIGSAPSLMFIFNFGSQYLNEAWHLPRSELGGWLVVPPLVFDVGAVTFGILASRANARPSLLILVATALAALLAFAPLAPSPAVAIALFSVSGAGSGGISVLVTTDVLARVPIERTSTAGGLCAAAQSLAHIVASPIVGAAIDRSHRYEPTLIVLGLLAIPTSLTFVLWPSLRRR